MSAPKNIASAAPFEQAYRRYALAGWNVLPLPEKRKQHPPGVKTDGEAFTGRQGRLAEDEDYERWLAAPLWHKGNIAIRPGNVVEQNGIEYEAIGIDIDGYGEKRGLAHLRELEKSYGPLPNTWTSSARSDGLSGIRWYLSPAGFEYMGKPRLASTGKASDSIEIVQRIHRYGVVFPSLHPEGMQYQWYATGQAPDGQHVANTIPRATQLAVLPDSWFRFLTRNGTESTGTAPIDMESSDKELRDWAKVHLQDGVDVCKTMAVSLERALDRIENAGDHHEPLVNTHWHLYLNAAEGHTGWASAVKIVEATWLDRIRADNVRSLGEAKAEIMRSRYGALRRLKGLFDEWREQGLAYLADQDVCDSTKWVEPPKPKARTKRSSDWERNEDGNAEHFLYRYGNQVKYVVNHADGAGRWLLFDDKEKRWIVDTKDVLVRNLYRQIKIRQVRDANRAFTAANNAVQAAGGTTAATPAQNFALREAKAWLVWATESGNKSRVVNSLAQATTYPNVSILFEDLDRDLMLLPVANGVIRFHTKTEREKGAKPFEFVEDSALVKDLMVTQNTHVPYIPLADQKNHSDPQVRENYRQFREYMSVFLRKNMSQEAFDYCLRLLGLSILGVNIKKAIFLVGKRDTGKSTFQKMMAACLGDLAIWREPAIFEDTPFKPALAEALSRRVCMVGELGEKHMDASLFKRITGGDEVSCNLKNVNKPVTLSARCTIISGCNSAPEVPNVDDATKERFVVIPFRHQVSRAVKDTSKQDELMEACKVPLLALLVEACAQGVEHGISEVPDELQLETKAFVSSLSEMSDFIQDRLTVVPEEELDKYSRKGQEDPRDPKPRIPDELTVGTGRLYKVYEEYTRINNMETLSSNRFTRRMQDAGFERDGSKNKDKELRWIGITLRPIAGMKTAESYRN